MSAETITKLKKLCDERADLIAKAQAAAAEFTIAAAGKVIEIDNLARTLVTIPAEGSVSLNVDNAYTIKLARTTTRKADTYGLMSNWEKLTPALQSAFKFEAEVKLKELRALSKDDAQTAATYYSTTISDPKLSIEVRK